MHKFNKSFAFHFYIIGLMFWIRTNVSTEGLQFDHGLDHTPNSPWTLTIVKSTEGLVKPVELTIWAFRLKHKLSPFSGENFLPPTALGPGQVMPQWYLPYLKLWSSLDQ